MGIGVFHMGSIPFTCSKPRSVEKSTFRGFRLQSQLIAGFLFCDVLMLYMTRHPSKNKKLHTNLHTESGPMCWERMIDMALYHPRVVVICGRCYGPCRWDPPTGEEPYGHWHIDEPCPKCGAEEWVAHDPGRDPRTGRMLDNAPVFGTRATDASD